MGSAVCDVSERIFLQSIVGWKEVEESHHNFTSSILRNSIQPMCYARRILNMYTGDVSKVTREGKSDEKKKRREGVM